MLNTGWKVLAVDITADGFDNIRLKVQKEYLHNLEVKEERFESVSLPSADLVNGSFSLPFCHPDVFHLFWNRIVDAINFDGRFSGNFFGNRDEWTLQQDVTFKTESQVIEMFDGFDIEYFNEIEFDGPTVFDNIIKHWHIFEVIAKKKVEKGT